MDYFEEVKRVGLIVEETQRVVTDRSVYILGEKFDAEDLYVTMMNVEDSPSSTVITSERMAKAMENLGIIKGTSYSWGTNIKNEKKLREFLDMLRKALGE